MKTYEELALGIRRATSITDLEALMSLATELDALQTPQAEALASRSLGWILYCRGDYATSLSHYHRALALHEQHGERSGVAEVISSIGMVHHMTGDDATALSHYHRALALHEELGDGIGVARVMCNTLVSYVSMGSVAEAQQLLATLDGMHISAPDVRIQRERQRATLQERSGDLDSAAATLQRALNEALEHGLRSQTASMHEALRDLAQKRNDFAAYIEHDNEFTRITEEINGKATTQKLAMMEAQKHIDAERAEMEKHRALLYSTLPPLIADRVLQGEIVNDTHDHAVVMFMDMVGFTTMSASIDPNDVVRLLSDIFTACDTIIADHGMLKIKTIGDSYMSVAFPSDELQAASSEQRAASAASAMLRLMSDQFPKISVRIGLHCGPVTAGVIGTQRLQYDVWGDTVNVASRMESTCEPGRIQVSQAFADVLRSSFDPAPFTLTQRGEVEIKGKGAMQTFWLEENAS